MVRSTVEKNRAEINIACMCDVEEQCKLHNVALEGLTERMKFE